MNKSLAVALLVGFIVAVIVGFIAYGIATFVPFLRPYRNAIGLVLFGIVALFAVVVPAINAL